MRLRERVWCVRHVLNIPICQADMCREVDSVAEGEMAFVSNPVISEVRARLVLCSMTRLFGISPP